MVTPLYLWFGTFSVIQDQGIRCQQARNQASSADTTANHKPSHILCTAVWGNCQCKAVRLTWSS